MQFFQKKTPNLFLKDYFNDNAQKTFGKIQVC